MSKATRQAFGEVLANLGERFPEIVVLDADLSKSTKTDIFAKKFPSRFFEMGIAEANMIGTASGLALAGKIPFACSFGAFLTGRYDTIRMSIVYSEMNVRLVGTHAGVGIGDDGHSQMGLEDISLMRSLPNMGIFQPMDSIETAQIMEYLVKTWKGPAYLRLTRQALPDLYPTGIKFKPGKLLQLPVKGKLDAKPKVLCLASGATVTEALQAAEALTSHGITMSVWNVHCLKPFDEATLRDISQSCKLIVTVEDHSVVGGLGSIVSETLAEEGGRAPVLRLGIQDRFGESAEAAELYDKHGISAKGIVRNVLKAYPKRSN